MNGKETEQTSIAIKEKETHYTCLPIGELSTQLRLDCFWTPQVWGGCPILCLKYSDIEVCTQVSSFLLTVTTLEEHYYKRGPFNLFWSQYDRTRDLYHVAGWRSNLTTPHQQLRYPSFFLPSSPASEGYWNQLVLTKVLWFTVPAGLQQIPRPNLFGSWVCHKK